LVKGDTSSIKTDILKIPLWLKIERRGEKFTTFHSVDGQKWQEIGTDTLKMHPHAVVGLVVTSHDATQAATAQFDNLTFTKR
jgi:regulation of enolase protein 1 (concanavalin A-like superfamily)